jgi:4'-phosphopantetheinyl transferase
VDVERIRPVSAWRQIAARYFSERENQALGVLADDEALQAFFRGWTRKEAYAKALGQGVSRRWTQFPASLGPNAAVELLDAAAEASPEGPFTLCPVDPRSGYVAAIAAQGTAWRLICWQWSWVRIPLRG